MEQQINLNNNYNIKRSKKRINKQHNVLIILFICTFLFTDIIKEIIINNIGISIKIPFLSIMLIIYLLIFFRRNNWILIFAMISLVLTLLSSMVYGYSFGAVVRSTNTILFPLLLISIKIYEPKVLVKKIIKIMNSIVVIYVFFGMIDYLGNGFIREGLAHLLGTSYYKTSIIFDLSTGVYRWFSLFGHSLVNATYIILFLITNIIYEKIYNEAAKFNLYTIYIISILGIVLSNSKFGLIIVSILLITNVVNEKRKFVYISIIIIATIILLNSNYFQTNIVTRFKYAIDSGDISNGRILVLNELINSGLYKINLFLGRGMSSSDILVKIAFSNNSGLSNMEIPILMFLYEYGVLYTIILYLIMIIYPCYILLKNRRNLICLFVLLFFIFINSYNGIANGVGTLQLYTYMVMIFINICSDSEENIIRRKFI